MRGLLISGALGRMGRMIAQDAPAAGFQVVCGVDRIAESSCDFPVYTAFTDIKEKADLLVDFSSPAVLPKLLAYACAQKLPCVLGTTGYTPEDMESIAQAARMIPVFQARNMSRGVYVLRQLAAQVARMLPDFDIEIIEKHHNQKVDSPSGTAMILLEAVGKDDSLPIYGREGAQCKRRPNEIGVHAVRGGTVAGEHDVGFYGNNEVITLSHAAQSRGVFVAGALAAASWLVGKPAGLYGMADLMEEK